MSFGYMQTAKPASDLVVDLVLPFQFRLPDGTFSPRAKIKVVAATRENVAYWTARSHGIRAGLVGQIDTAALKQIAMEDRSLFARFVIVGWHDETIITYVGEPDASDTPEVGAAKRKPTPFSQAKLVEWLDALPDDLFAFITAFCWNADNFRPMNVQQGAKHF